MLAAAAAIILLSACSSIRTRTFEADRAGAEAAIRLALSQEQPEPLQLVLKRDLAPARHFEWRYEGFPRSYMKVSAIVVIDRDEFRAEYRARQLEATAEGLNAAAALRPGDANSEWAVLLRVPNRYPQAPHAWHWYTTTRGPIAILEGGLCIDVDCADFADIRSIWAVPYRDPLQGKAEPTMLVQLFPISRGGALAAVQSATAGKGSVAVEMSTPAGVGRERLASFRLCRSSRTDVCAATQTSGRLEQPSAAIRSRKSSGSRSATGIRRWGMRSAMRWRFRSGWWEPPQSPWR